MSSISRLLECPIRMAQIGKEGDGVYKYHLNDVIMLLLATSLLSLSKWNKCS